MIKQHKRISINAKLHYNKNATAQWYCGSLDYGISKKYMTI